MGFLFRKIEYGRGSKGARKGKAVMPDNLDMVKLFCAGDAVHSNPTATFFIDFFNEFLHVYTIQYVLLSRRFSSDDLFIQLPISQKAEITRFLTHSLSSHFSLAPGSLHLQSESLMQKVLNTP